MAFGDRLKEARELAGYSRAELAEKLAVTKSAISNYENGVSSPKEEILLKLFNILNIEPNYLFQDSFTKGNLQQEELQLVKAYRKQPELHMAVKKLLGVNASSTEKSSKTDLLQNSFEIAAMVDDDLESQDMNEFLKNNRKASSVD